MTDVRTIFNNDDVKVRRDDDNTSYIVELGNAYLEVFDNGEVLVKVNVKEK